MGEPQTHAQATNGTLPDDVRLMSTWQPPDQPPYMPPPPYAPPSPTPAHGRRSLWPVVAIVLVVVAFVAGLVIGQGDLFGPPPTAGGPSPSVPTPSPGQPTPTPAPGQTPDPTVTSPPATGPLPTGAPANFELFWQALEHVRQNFVGRANLTDEQLTYGAIRGLIDALGDTGHSTFFTPEQLAAEQEALEGRVVGVGALLGERNGRPVIVSVVSGGPASRAGMRSGDLLVAVDGINVETMTPADIAQRVRGDAGTTVVVEVFRPASDETLEFSMVREEISFPAADWAFVPGTQVAVLRLIQFSTAASDQLRAARDEALAQGAQGFVLDLRSNPGGFVVEAVRVASLFLEAETVYIRELASGERISVGTCAPADNPGRIGDCRPEDSGPATGLSLVVLIDQGTASSAEIVSGAIRSAGRAELVGQTTFGTGTVLLTYKLADGSAIRVAVERWLTPDGELIFGQGIQPTVEVDMPPEARALEPQELSTLDPLAVPTMEDVQLLRALEILGALP